MIMMGKSIHQIWVKTDPFMHDADCADINRVGCLHFSFQHYVHGCIPDLVAGRNKYV